MKTKITTDWHLGAKRVGGSTPASQQALKQRLRDALQAQLDDNDHLIAGDLLESFTVDTAELVETYKIFSAWLAKYGRRLALIRGNHDWHPSGLNRFSSFDLLGTILTEQFPEQVTVASDVTEWKQFILVPHLPNNEVLNVEVSKLAGVSGKVVVFHANVDNFFAAETQHSLCLSMNQVEDLVSRGNLIICGHEHQHRKLVNGRCVILGNTEAASVADCLGSPFKYSAMVEAANYELTETWRSPDHFIELDWRDAGEATLAHNFVRITGDATAAESADVIATISKFRQRHDENLFAVSNAVRIDGAEAISEMTGEAVSDIHAFDVLSEIYAELNPEEVACVKGLLE